MYTDKELYLQIQKDGQNEIVEIDNRKYSTKTLAPVFEPEQPVIKVSTLTAIVDYVEAVPSENYFIHVISQTEVALKKYPSGDFKQIEQIVHAKHNPVDIIFNKFISSEKMNIQMQACFAEYEGTHKKDVLLFSANVTSTIETGVTDDGTSQGVTLKSGVSNNKKAVLPNPVKLAPFRTFNEIEQPASHFIFRSNQELEFALYEADGGTWKNTAILLIADYLKERLPNVAILA